MPPSSICNDFYASCSRVSAAPAPQAGDRDSTMTSCSSSRGRRAEEALGIEIGAALASVPRELRQSRRGDRDQAIPLSTATMSTRVIHIFSKNLHGEPRMLYDRREALPGPGRVRSQARSACARARARRAAMNSQVPVSVGIGPTKTLAKVGNHLPKKDAPASGGRPSPHRTARQEALGRLELSKLAIGIARRFAEQLRAIGIPITLVPGL